VRLDSVYWLDSILHNTIQYNIRLLWLRRTQAIQETKTAIIRSQVLFSPMQYAVEYDPVQVARAHHHRSL